MASMRFKYISVMDFDVSSPLCIFFCKSSMVSSFNEYRSIEPEAESAPACDASVSSFAEDREGIVASAGMAVAATVVVVMNFLLFKDGLRFRLRQAQLSTRRLSLSKLGLML